MSANMRKSTLDEILKKNITYCERIGDTVFIASDEDHGDYIWKADINTRQAEEMFSGGIALILSQEEYDNLQPVTDLSTLKKNDNNL